MLLAINSMLVNQQSVLNETSLNKNAYKTRLCAKLLLSCPTLTLWTVVCQAPLSIWILQARILERVAMPSSGDPSNPEIESVSLKSLALAGRFFTTSAT